MESLKRVAVCACGLFAASLSAQESGIWSFAIDAARSDVHWRVYKAGVFSRLGHNHVIAVNNLSGKIEVPTEFVPDWEKARWYLEFAAADLVVDDADIRSRYGEEFASDPTLDDVAGTRRNMLGEQVLQENAYPTIRVTGVGLAGTMQAASLQVEVEMLGRTIALELPGSISVSDDEIVAEGTFSLEHADLGLEPFSAMMRTLRVAERLDFHYRIYAVKSAR